MNRRPADVALAYTAVACTGTTQPSITIAAAACRDGRIDYTSVVNRRFPSGSTWGTGPLPDIPDNDELDHDVTGWGYDRLTQWRQTFHRPGPGTYWSALCCNSHYPHHALARITLTTVPGLAGIADRPRLSATPLEDPTADCALSIPSNPSWATGYQPATIDSLAVDQALRANNYGLRITPYVPYQPNPTNPNHFQWEAVAIRPLRHSRAHPAGGAPWR